MLKENLIQNGMYKVIESLYHKHQNSKFDIYYEEGKGALVVPHEYPLREEFIVAKINEANLISVGLGITKL